MRLVHLPQVLQGSATALPWPDESFDAVLTDPPYYDNVPYADLSDFFYVWLKRTIGDLHPDLFATPLTPKAQEIVADASKAGSMEAARHRFEEMLTQSFREIYRVLKPEGLAVIVFAYPRTEAWEAVIGALLSAGLYLTASWPIHTEMSARLRAQESAALASSIYMVCRKRTTHAIGDYATVRPAIRARIRERLPHFWRAGIRGADFFMSAIGPAVEVFGRYARVERHSGEPVTVADLLNDVRQEVAEYALEQILGAGGVGGLDPATRFYILWRWTFGRARVPFDEARKLGQAVGVEVRALTTPGGFVRQKGEEVMVLGPHERDQRLLEGSPATLLDALHQAALLWERSQRSALADLLARRGSEEFWLVAQAIAAVLPAGEKEKQLLEGLLGARASGLEHPRLW